MRKDKAGQVIPPGPHQELDARLFEPLKPFGRPFDEDFVSIDRVLQSCIRVLFNGGRELRSLPVGMSRQIQPQAIFNVSQQLS